MSGSLLLQTYHEYEWELLRFLGKRLGSTSMASDIAHELYLKLLRTKEIPNIRDHKAYLFSMAANLAIDYQLVEKRRNEILTEVNELVWRKEDKVTPERQAMAKAESDFLEAEVAKLSPRSRRIFYLSRYEGKSQAEVAEILDVGLTTVYKDLKATMNALIKARRKFQGRSSKNEG